MEINNEQLTQSERAQMKGNMRAFMAEHPARAPFTLRFMDRISSAAGAVGGVFVLPRARLVSALALAVLFLGAGTSYAAESSLPGDALYTVKININEKIAEALAPDPSARAAVLAVHTLRRLQEAETLAAQGRLTASTSAEIQSALQTIAADFDESVKAVARSPVGVAHAADLQSDLAVTLDSHARALSVIQATIPQTSTPLTLILAEVVAHAERAKEAQAQADTAVAASTSPAEADAVAGEERKNAEDALSQVRSLTARTKTSLGAASAEAIAHRADDAENALRAGEEHLHQGDPGGATDAFRTAIRTAAQARADVDTAVHLKKLLPLLGTTSSTDTGSTPADGSDPSSEF